MKRMNPRIKIVDSTSECANQRFVGVIRSLECHMSARGALADWCGQLFLRLLGTLRCKEYCTSPAQVTSSGQCRIVPPSPPSGSMLCFVRYVRLPGKSKSSSPGAYNLICMWAHGRLRVLLYSLMGASCQSHAAKVEQESNKNEQKRLGETASSPFVGPQKFC